MENSVLAVRHQRAGGHLTVLVSGEIDAATTLDLIEQVVPLVQPGGDTVWLDLSEVTFCDSTGLRALLVIKEATESAGDRVVLLRPCAILRRVLKATGLDTAFDIRQDAR